MRASLFGALIATIGLVTAAEAASRKPADAKVVLEPLRLAATRCFAETVLANPKAVALARAGHWYEAAGIAGFLCRPEVDAMVQAHDRLYGPGSGNQYFELRYTEQLGRDLAAQLRPMLERKSVANAAPVEEASVSDAGRNGAQTPQ